MEEFRVFIFLTTKCLYYEGLHTVILLNAKLFLVRIFMCSFCHMTPESIFTFLMCDYMKMFFFISNSFNIMCVVSGLYAYKQGGSDPILFFRGTSSLTFNTNKFSSS